MPIEPIRKGKHLSFVNIQLGPRCFPPPGRPEPRYTEFGAVSGGQFGHPVQLAEIPARQDCVDTDLNISFLQTPESSNDLLETSSASDSVVGGGGGAFQADLDVNQRIVQSAGDVIIDKSAVGADAGDHPFFMGMIHEIQEIRSHKGFTAADVELENLHGR
jgi:hypothetical protein